MQPAHIFSIKIYYEIRIRVLWKGPGDAKVDHAWLKELSAKTPFIFLYF